MVVFEKITLVLEGPSLLYLGFGQLCLITSSQVFINGLKVLEEWCVLTIFFLLFLWQVFFVFFGIVEMLKALTMYGDNAITSWILNCSFATKYVYDECIWDF